MNSSPIRISVVDDRRMMAEGLAAGLRAEIDFEILGIATSCDELHEHLGRHTPDVAIIDMGFRGVGPCGAVREIESAAPNARILILTAQASDVVVEAALRMQASGLLSQSESLEFLAEAVRRVHAGEQCFSDCVRERLVFDAARRRYSVGNSDGVTGLTGRQLEVLRYLARGDSVKQVARSLHLSQKSVDSHKYRIMHKLGVHDRVELARLAIREGLLLP